ncbi:glycosyltransferase [Rubritalea profundi]|uniref:Glycosyl transferase family 1 domain-containing protein n=1 Tax=Rubritalea profundi TaxID=1658618 RepID=A0A2S7U174_9BACT|nr:glycosyltransferase [Rubritalea profundi]PQJ28082.1 hypothetical protein BSZ32_05900 [Rubritalea profundi]
MKVLIDSSGLPFSLAHGGATTQVVETVNALREIGVDVEYARWWDSHQHGDLIHVFGTPSKAYIDFARAKRIPVINTTLFTETCNRSPENLRIQGLMVSALLKIPAIPPWGAIRSQLKWSSYKACDLNIVGLNVEADVLRKVYSVPDEKIKLIPLGLSQHFLKASHGEQLSDSLITTGTITERKRSLELATMAKAAKVPVHFIGKPYDEDGAYWKSFKALIDDKYVMHTPHTESVDEMVRLLKQSKGYILYSDYENWCLSAHEAIACGIPILIPDQPWSRELFGDQASYLLPGKIDENTLRLKTFYDSIPSLKAPDISLYSWNDVARQLVATYEGILQTPSS